MTNQTAAWSENLARYVFMPKEKYNNDKEVSLLSPFLK